MQTLIQSVCKSLALCRRAVKIQNKKNSEANPWSNGMKGAYGDSGERDILSRRKREGRGGTETSSS
jgi:hypothetical protein